MPWRQNLSRKKKAVVFTNVTANAYQSRLNAGFPKLCKIVKVCTIESLKYIREFHTPVCYCGDISTPQNVMLNETNCDWLFVGLGIENQFRFQSRILKVRNRILVVKLKFRFRLSIPMRFFFFICEDRCDLAICQDLAR